MDYLSKNRYGIKLREQQKKMISIIENTLENDEISIIEAGTGTGKTLSYLLPIIKYLVENPDKKIVISTNTINLQEQIVNKDIKIAFDILKNEVEYKLVKGRNNFICVKRFDEVYKNKEGLKYIQKKEIEEIKEWFDKTITGDRSEYTKSISPELWEKIASNKYDPIPKSSEYFSNCFYNKQKQEIKDARLLIVNHHLLLTDKKLKEEKKQGLLPKYDAIIFDEAHNLQEIARNYYSSEISMVEISKLSGLIYNFKNKNSNSLFDKVLKIIEMENILLLQKVQEYEKQYIELLIGIYKKVINIYEMLKEENNRKMGNFLFKESIKKIDKLEKEIIELENDVFNYKEINEKIIEIIDENNLMLSDNTENIKNYKNISKEYISNLLIFVQIIYEAVEEIKNNEESLEFVYHIKYNKNDTIVCKSKLDISKEFRNSFEEKIKKISFVSATINVSHSETNMKYFKENLGLVNTEDYIIKSPFNYDEQMNIYSLVIENDDYEKIIYISKYIMNKGGNTLLLFTSYNKLEQYAIELKKILPDFDIYIQGSINRTELIKNFKKSNKSILLGTDSFWEGVDIVGDDLTTVIIEKIPFKVPTDPIFYKMNLLYEKKGKNSFYEIQVPHAILKLKQGIGRLIRSENDFGNIIILDNRIINKIYGKIIRRAMYTEIKPILLEELNEI